MSDPLPSPFEWKYAHLEHRDKLPHVRQENVIYFVTFRLNDSLPPERVADLRQERAQWLRMNPAPHTPAQEQEYRKLWTVRVEKLLDAGYGKCVLRDPLCRDPLARTMLRGDGVHFRLGEFVIMPNHVHALLHVLPGRRLSEIIKAWKSSSAREIGRRCGRRGSYWMDEYFDHAVRQEQSLAEFTDYIRQNPRFLPPGTFTIGRGILGTADLPIGRCGRTAGEDTGGTENRKQEDRR